LAERHPQQIDPQPKRKLPFVSNIMSDNEATISGKGKKVMSEADVSFFGTCLEHTTAGPVIVSWLLSFCDYQIQ
jgi:hypothetical protein